MVCWDGWILSYNLHSGDFVRDSCGSLCQSFSSAETGLHIRCEINIRDMTTQADDSFHFILFTNNIFHSIYTLRSQLHIMTVVY